MNHMPNKGKINGVEVSKIISFIASASRLLHLWMGDFASLHSALFVKFLPRRKSYNVLPFTV